MNFGCETQNKVLTGIVFSPAPHDGDEERSLYSGRGRGLVFVGLAVDDETEFEGFENGDGAEVLKRPSLADGEGAVGVLFGLV